MKAIKQVSNLWRLRIAFARRNRVVILDAGSSENRDNEISKGVEMNYRLLVLVITLQTLALAPACAQWSQEYSIQRIGLFGPEQTGSAGLQFAVAGVRNAPGIIAGFSFRYTGVNTLNGQDAWIWNGTTTTQVGLTGAAYTNGAGSRSSEAYFQNPAGPLIGKTNRINGSNTSAGDSWWMRNGNTTTHIGLSGYDDTIVGPLQSSIVRQQNAIGWIAGGTFRYGAGTAYRGIDAWIWNGAATIQLGFTGEGYSQRIGGDPVGQQESQTVGLTDAGQAAGFSERFATPAYLGRDAWVWSNGTTTRIGLRGEGYTNSTGYYFCYPVLQNNAGQIAGGSRVMSRSGTDDGGVDAWVWNGTTTRIGLAGTGYTYSSGYRESSVSFQNEAGRVVGVSKRSVDSDDNGRDTWVWDQNSTRPIGLTGQAYTGSAGYQYGTPSFLNAAGQVSGISMRINGVNTWNGQNAWVSDGTTTTPIGLSGAAYAGSAGYQYSQASFQNSNGQVVGVSRRITGVNTDNGQDVWAWSGTTTQIGLIGAAYTGSLGYRSSTPQSQNAAGQVSGYSNRYTGVNTSNGRDAWFFDPITGLTSAIIGSTRSSDNYSFSSPIILTQDGYLLGTYTYFAGGVGTGEQRAFIFRPDRGFADLGSLVVGGLSANGWSTLRQPVYYDASTGTIVGHGYVNGQTSGQSVFAMILNPPTCAADFNADTVLDFFDYLDFVSAFAANQPAADYNADTVIDFFDYLDFVAAFANGC